MMSVGGIDSGSFQTSQTQPTLEVNGCARAFSFNVKSRLPRVPCTQATVKQHTSRHTDLASSLGSSSRNVGPDSLCQSRLSTRIPMNRPKAVKSDVAESRNSFSLSHNVNPSPSLMSCGTSPSVSQPCGHQSLISQSSGNTSFAANPLPANVFPLNPPAVSKVPRYAQPTQSALTRLAKAAKPSCAEEWVSLTSKSNNPVKSVSLTRNTQGRVPPCHQAALSTAQAVRKLTLPLRSAARSCTTHSPQSSTCEQKMSSYLLPNRQKFKAFQGPVLSIANMTKTEARITSAFEAAPKIFPNSCNVGKSVRGGSEGVMRLSRAKAASSAQSTLALLSKRTHGSTRQSNQSVTSAFQSNSTVASSSNSCGTKLLKPAYSVSKESNNRAAIDREHRERGICRQSKQCPVKKDYLGFCLRRDTESRKRTQLQDFAHGDKVIRTSTSIHKPQLKRNRKKSLAQPFKSKVSQVNSSVDLPCSQHVKDNANPGRPKAADCSSVAKSASSDLSPAARSHESTLHNSVPSPAANSQALNSQCFQMVSKSVDYGPDLTFELRKNDKTHIANVPLDTQKSDHLTQPQFFLDIFQDNPPVKEESLFLGTETILDEIQAENEDILVKARDTRFSMRASGNQEPDSFSMGLPIHYHALARGVCHRMASKKNLDFHRNLGEWMTIVDVVIAEKTSDLDFTSHERALESISTTSQSLGSLALVAAGAADAAQQQRTSCIGATRWSSLSRGSVAVVIHEEDTEERLGEAGILLRETSVTERISRKSSSFWGSRLSICGTLGLTHHGLSMREYTSGGGQHHSTPQPQQMQNRLSKGVSKQSQLATDPTPIIKNELEELLRKSLTKEESSTTQKALDNLRTPEASPFPLHLQNRRSIESDFGSLASLVRVKQLSQLGSTLNRLSPWNSTPNGGFNFSRGTPMVTPTQRPGGTSVSRSGKGRRSGCRSGSVLMASPSQHTRFSVFSTYSNSSLLAQAPRRSHQQAAAILLRGIRSRNVDEVINALADYSADPNGLLRIPFGQLPWTITAPFLEREEQLSAAPQSAKTSHKRLTKHQHISVHPLHYAATVSSPSVVQTLLKFGACPNALDQWHRNALHILLQPPPYPIPFAKKNECHIAKSPITSSRDEMESCMVNMPHNNDTSFCQLAHFLAKQMTSRTDLEHLNAEILCEAGLHLDHKDWKNRTVRDYISMWSQVSRHIRCGRITSTLLHHQAVGHHSNPTSCSLDGLSERLDNQFANSLNTVNRFSDDSSRNSLDQVPYPIARANTPTNQEDDSVQLFLSRVPERIADIVVLYEDRLRLESLRHLIGCNVGMGVTPTRLMTIPGADKNKDNKSCNHDSAASIQNTHNHWSSAVSHDAVNKDLSRGDTSNKYAEGVVSSACAKAFQKQTKRLVKQAQENLESSSFSITNTPYSLSEKECLKANEVNAQPKTEQTKDNFTEFLRLAQASPYRFHPAFSGVWEFLGATFVPLNSGDVTGANGESAPQGKPHNESTRDALDNAEYQKKFTTFTQLFYRYGAATTTVGSDCLHLTNVPSSPMSPPTHPGVRP